MKQVRLYPWSLVHPTPHVESVCQQLLTKAMANENHTWNLTLKIKIWKLMWNAPKKVCKLTLLSFLNSSQTVKSPKLFWGLESRIEVWKLHAKYITKHFFVKIKEHQWYWILFYSSVRAWLERFIFCVNIFSLQLLDWIGLDLLAGIVSPRL